MFSLLLLLLLLLILLVLSLAAAVSTFRTTGAIPMAIRGHPRYRAFKILGGNFALGERVAPNEREIEVASRRNPTAAMTHASAAHVRLCLALDSGRERREGDGLGRFTLSERDGTCGRNLFSFNSV